MKIVKITTGILCLLYFTNCIDSQEKADKEFTPSSESYKDYDNKELIKELTSKILVQGDTISFNKLSEIYFLTNYQSEFLYHSFVMAEDFDYPKLTT